MKKKQVALFGGAFDPPHKGHSQVATVVTQDFIDEVWFVPVFKHPWAAKYGKEVMAPYEDRKAMLELILGKNQKIAEYKEVGYTYPTLQYFEEKYPDTHFSWIMGSEYISRFDAFLEGHPQLANYTFYMYPRKGYPLDNLFPNMVGLFGMTEVAVSSTLVRDTVLSGADLDAFV
ncbi:MAG: nicotinate-nicotinamide nucleotide adenylyltransferase, partial [Candidatus Pacebacteria bacterium]|nr:nicotinate-nicotinamide nucleotide adenylyltransferase [Candidatus Paceibacterota bacterium]